MVKCDFHQNVLFCVINPIGKYGHSVYARFCNSSKYGELVRIAISFDHLRTLRQPKLVVKVTYVSFCMQF